MSRGGILLSARGALHGRALDRAFWGKTEMQPEFREEINLPDELPGLHRFASSRSEVA